MQVRKTTANNESLNNCVNELCTCLPEHATQLLTELAQDYNLPLWQVFCGVVLEMHMEGNLSNFFIDPAWADGLKSYSYHCKHCDKAFTPINLGQVFCSNACGEAHNNGKTTTNKPVIDTGVAANSNNLIERLADIINKKEQETSGWSSDAAGVIQ